MAEPMMIFAAQEYRDRVAKLQMGMAAQGLDALLLTTAADIFYVTGFLTRFWASPARPWFVIVPVAVTVAANSLPEKVVMMVSSPSNVVSPATVTETMATV